jgi:hypothetical protein
MQKCVVGSVVDNEASSAFDKSLQPPFDALGPLNSFLRMAAVEIIDDNLIPGEVRVPLTECLWSDGGDLDAETACFIKNGPNAKGSGRPIVIVDAIDNQDPDLRRAEGSYPDQTKKKSNRPWKADRHDSLNRLEGQAPDRRRRRG